MNRFQFGPMGLAERPAKGGIAHHGEIRGQERLLLRNLVDARENGGQPRPERQQHEHPPEPPLRLLIPQDGEAVEDLPADKFVAGKHARGLQPVRRERGEDPVGAVAHAVEDDGQLCLFQLFPVHVRISFASKFITLFFCIQVAEKPESTGDPGRILYSIADCLSETP